jgi:hypothetical protein
MGETFEGERGVWNPDFWMMYVGASNNEYFLNHDFRFLKQNKEMKIPDDMKHSMPLIFLDGELWLF